MSTNVGTLQPKVHMRGPLVWAVVALFVAATIGVYALTTSESHEKTASSTATAVHVMEARNAMLASYQHAPIAVEIVDARNAMLASYQHAPIAVEIVEARNAMLASYQQGSGDEIRVNGEPCAICWKYR